MWWCLWKCAVSFLAMWSCVAGAAMIMWIARDSFFLLLKQALCNAVSCWLFPKCQICNDSVPNPLIFFLCHLLARTTKCCFYGDQPFSEIMIDTYRPFQDVFCWNWPFHATAICMYTLQTGYAGISCIAQSWLACMCHCKLRLLKYATSCNCNWHAHIVAGFFHCDRLRITAVSSKAVFAENGHLALIVIGTSMMTMQVVPVGISYWVHL